ncbi:MAG: SAM-dependent methyltransferase, partial [Rickettsiales bacterium]
YITSLPGASSVPLALTLSGLPTDHFLFAGFLPPKQQARQKALQAYASLPYTLVFLEAPHRLVSSLGDMATVLGNRSAAVARELTKRHEDVRRETLEALQEQYQTTPPKGEIVIVVAPASSQATVLEGAELDAALIALLKDHSVKEASAQLASETGLPRKTLYARALELKDQ